MESEEERKSFCRQLTTFIGQRYQLLLDKSVPHHLARWTLAICYLSGFFIRVLVVRGWYIITYGLAIYLLNILLAFLTPKIDPAMQDLDDDGPGLPTRQSEEFRPFIRRLAEFKAWHSCMIATTISYFCTFFDCFNVPVFAPVLIMYFCLLFFLTMKRQIKHMIRYRYLPFTRGKPTYSKDGGPVGDGAVRAH